MSREVTAENYVYNVAMKDPEHLKKWLLATGRKYLVLDAIDLVNSLPFPDGVDSFIQIMSCYEDYRRTKPTGRVRVEVEPTLQQKVEVPVMKTQNLEMEELDRAIRFLIRQITEKDPKWTIENNPL